MQSVGVQQSSLLEIDQSHWSSGISSQADVSHPLIIRMPLHSHQILIEIGRDHKRLLQVLPIQVFSGVFYEDWFVPYQYLILKM